MTSVTQITLRRYLVPACVAITLGVAAGVGITFALLSHLVAAVAVSMALACAVLVFSLSFAIALKAINLARPTKPSVEAPRIEPYLVGLNQEQIEAMYRNLGWYPAIPSLVARPTVCYVDRGPMRTKQDSLYSALVLRLLFNNSHMSARATLLYGEMYDTFIAGKVIATPITKEDFLRHSNRDYTYNEAKAAEKYNKLIVGNEDTVRISKENFLCCLKNVRNLLYIGDESFCVGMTLAYMRIVRALNDPASIISLWRDDGNKNTVLNEIFRTTIDGISASYCGIKFIDFERAIKPRVPHGIHNLCWMVHRASGGQKFAVKVREPLCYLECEGEAPSPAEPSEDRGAAARRKDPLPLQSLSVLAHIKNMKGGAGLEANYSAFLNTLTPGQREHPIWRTLSRTIRKQYAAQSVKEEGGTLVNCTEIIDALLLAAHHLYGEPPQQPSPELQGAGAVGVVATRAEVGA